MKKNHYGFFSSQNGTGKAENERKKNIIVPIHSNTTRNREFQKIAKKFKRLKNIIMASFEGKTRRDRLRMREKKNCSCEFQANPKYRILKNIAKKFKNFNMAYLKAKTGRDRLRMRGKKKLSF